VGGPVIEAVLGFDRTGQVDPKRLFEPRGKARFPMRYLLAFLLILGFAAPEYRLQAQSLECGANDSQCLDDSFAVACSSSLEAFEQSCLAWAQRVEAHELAENPEWRLAAGAGYFNLADLTDSAAAAERYREQSRAIIQAVLEQWPTGSYARQAYMGLANLAFLETEDISEAIRLTRLALQAEPDNEISMWALATWLARRAENGDRREAADMYRAAYVARGSRSWYWAANALGLYRSTGQTDQAEIFLDQVSRDSGMDGFDEEVVSSSFARDPERAAEVLETACHSYIIAMFGAETCANGIDTLVSATRSVVVPAERRRIVGAATEGMRMLTIAGDATGEQLRQRQSEFGTILREWIATEAATAATYVLWAQHTDSDLEEGIAAFERAVELAPDNGRYRYWLAQGYIARRRFDEAIENLNLARDTLPENVGITVESVDREIRRAEYERALGR
jgi:tetratricopeptide (TPR) repeat protein